MNVYCITVSRIAVKRRSAYRPVMRHTVQKASPAAAQSAQAPLADRRERHHPVEQFHRQVHVQHYTVDGVEIEGDDFTLNKDVTASDVSPPPIQRRLKLTELR
ncbi:MAG: hypothetical protein LBK73_12430 [Treponema sp.]|nr:hypothetical protein [Treponema sp.]